MIKLRPTNLVCDRAFEGYDGLQLPKSPRTYLDGFACEFNDIDIRTKLYHFGYLASRGVDFYQDLRDNIDEKMSNPQYQDYEDTSRHSFARYLEELCGKNQSYYYKSFDTLYHTLVKELKERYYEYRDYETNEMCYGFKKLEGV